MDPEVTLRLLTESIALRCVDSVEDHAESLRHWLAMGGFRPASLTSRIPIYGWMSKSAKRDLTLINQFVHPM